MDLPEPAAASPLRHGAGRAERWLAAVCLIAWPAAAAWLVGMDHHPLGGWSWAAWMCVAFSLLSAAALWMALGEVVVGGQGIERRRFGRRVHIGWNEITRIEYRLATARTVVRAPGRAIAIFRSWSRYLEADALLRERAPARAWPPAPAFPLTVETCWRRNLAVAIASVPVASFALSHLGRTYKAEWLVPWCAAAYVLLLGWQVWSRMVTRVEFLPDGVRTSYISGRRFDELPRLCFLGRVPTEFGVALVLGFDDHMFRLADIDSSQPPERVYERLIEEYRFPAPDGEPDE